MALPKNGDFSELLGEGENPNGMIAQTPNGTVTNGLGGDGDQFRYSLIADGARWNTDPRQERSVVELAAAAPSLPRGRVSVMAHTRRKRR